MLSGKFSVPAKDLILKNDKKSHPRQCDGGGLSTKIKLYVRTLDEHKKKARVSEKFRRCPIGTPQLSRKELILIPKQEWQKEALGKIMNYLRGRQIRIWWEIRYNVRLRRAVPTQVNIN